VAATINAIRIGNPFVKRLQKSNNKLPTARTKKRQDMPAEPAGSTCFLCRAIG